MEGELFAKLSYANILVAEEGRKGVIEFLRGQGFSGPIQTSYRLSIIAGFRLKA